MPLRVGVCSIGAGSERLGYASFNPRLPNQMLYPHPLRTVVEPCYWEPRLEAGANFRSTWNRVESVGPDAVTAVRQGSVLSLGGADSADSLARFVVDSGPCVVLGRVPCFFFFSLQGETLESWKQARPPTRLGGATLVRLVTCLGMTIRQHCISMNHPRNDRD